MKETFIQKYYPYAREAEKRTGVPTLFALAQSALESGWGKKTPGHMLFGIKTGSGKNYGGWEGKSQLITTTEYARSANRSFPFIEPGYPVLTSNGRWKYRIKDYFRAYTTPFHTFMDWAGLLTKSTRYAIAMKSKSDPYRFAEQVAKAGYATDPNYTAKVKRIMRQISQVIKAKGLKKKNSLSHMIPIALTIGGIALVIYGITKYKKSSLAFN
ncbi:MAG: glucosaminidase domain-containing protein [Ekhidna sp.]